MLYPYHERTDSSHMEEEVESIAVNVASNPESMEVEERKRSRSRSLSERGKLFLGEQEVQLIQPSKEMNNAFCLCRKSKTDSIVMTSPQALTSVPCTENMKYGLIGWGSDIMLSSASENNAEAVIEPSILFESDQSDLPFNDVDIGAYHGVLWRDNHISLWGSSGDSQCAIEEESLSFPRKLKTDDLETIESVMCGANHTIIRFAFGGLAAFGDNSSGQCGVGLDTLQVKKPTLIFPSISFSQVACGERFNIGLTKDGTVYAWGDNSKGQLGRYKTEPKQDFKCEAVDLLYGHPVVKVACGGNHALICTAHRRVFAWGDNRYHQLGQTRGAGKKFIAGPVEVKILAGKLVLEMQCGTSHNIVLTNHSIWVWGRNQNFQCGTRPDMQTIQTPIVLKFDWIEKIRHVSCGANHTVCCSDNHIWAWGNNKQGQCTGVSTEDHVSRPLMVKANCLGENASIQKVKAGNFCTFCFVADQKSYHPHEYVWGCNLLSLHMLRQLIQESQNIGNSRLLKKSILTVFSSLSILNASFLSPVNSFPPRLFNGFEFSDVTAAFVMLDEIDPAVSTKLTKTLEKTASRITNVGSRLIDTTLCRFLFILLCNPKLANPGYSSKMLIKYAECLTSFLEPKYKQALTKRISNLEDDFFSKMVRDFQSIISNIVDDPSCQSVYSRPIRRAVLVLDLLNKSNEMRRPPLPPDRFYNRILTRKKNLLNFITDFKKYDSTGTKSLIQDGVLQSEYFSFCRFPFLLDSVAKTEVLHIESRMTQVNEMRNPQAHPLFVAPQFLVLRVDRTNLLGSTAQWLYQIAHKSPRHFKRPLKVKFHNEEGVDEGGVKKEFFQLLVREMFDLRYGLFELNEESRTYWFNKNSLEGDQQYYVLGLILGLAIYNEVICDVHFPQVVYKKLQDASLTLEDLEGLGLYSSLKQLLEYNGNVEDLGLDFSVTNRYFDETIVIPLKPKGEEIPVTNDNREEYAKLFMEYYLISSIQKQFDNFYKGFHAVIGGKALALCTPVELEQLICGNPTLDFDALRAGTEYKDGYGPDHECIVWLWEVLRDFTNEQRKKFLAFTTGSSRSPLRGLHELHMKVVKAGPDLYNGSRLPTAHTCFNTLILPYYRSKNLLYRKLVIAIENSEGFGLQ